MDSVTMKSGPQSAFDRGIYTKRRKPKKITITQKDIKKISRGLRCREFKSFGKLFPERDRVDDSLDELFGN